MDGEVLMWSSNSRVKKRVITHDMIKTSQKAIGRFVTS